MVEKIKFFVSSKNLHLKKGAPFTSTFADFLPRFLGSLGDFFFGKKGIFFQK